MNESVQAKELKELHPGSGYTPFQYRIWAEMIIGGVHHSMDAPPTQSTMFVRAGGRKTNVKTGSSNDSLSQAIVQIASALSPQTNQATRVPSFKASPGKII